VPTLVAPQGWWQDGTWTETGSTSSTVVLYNTGPGWLEVTGGNGKVYVSPGAPPPPPDGGGGDDPIATPPDVPPGGDPPPPLPPTALPKNYAFTVTGYLGNGSGDVAWSGPADSVSINATGDVDSLSIAGDATIEAAWTVGNVSGKIVRVDAGKSVGDVVASDRVVKVSAGTTVGKISATHDIIDVMAGSDILGDVSAGGNIGSLVSIGYVVGSIAAGGDIGLVSAGPTDGFSPLPDSPPPEPASILGNVTAGRDIVTVWASKDILGHVTASRNIETIWAARNLTTSIPQAGGGEVPLTIAATAGHIHRVVAGNDISANITAGTDVGDSLDWPDQAQLFGESGDGTTFPWMPSNPFPYDVFWDPAASEAGGVLAGGRITGDITAGSGDVSWVCSYVAFDGVVNAGSNVGGVAARAEVVGTIAAGQSVGEIWSGLSYPYEDAVAGKVEGSITAAGFVGAVGVWGGDVNAIVNAGTDIGSVSATRDIRGNIHAVSDIGDARAKTGVENADVITDNGDIYGVSAGTQINATIHAGNDIGSVIAGTQIDATIIAGYDIRSLTSGVTSGGEIRGNVEAAHNIDEVIAYGSGGASARPATLPRPENPTTDPTKGLDQNLWIINASQDQYQALSLPDEIPARPGIPTGGNIAAPINALGNIGTVTAFGQISGKVSAGKSLGNGGSTYQSSGVWAAGQITGDISSDEGSLSVRSWDKIKGSVTGRGDLQAWAYDDLLGDLESKEGKILAGSWDDVLGAADGQTDVDVRAYWNIGKDSSDENASATNKTLKSEAGPVRAWTARYMDSSVDAHDYAAVYARKSVELPAGLVRSATSDTYVQTTDGDVTVGSGNGGDFSNGAVAQDLVWLQAGQDMNANALSLGGSTVADAGRSIHSFTGGAKLNVWAAARDGDANVNVASTDGWGYVWAAKKLTGTMRAKQTVSATSFTDVDAELTSTDLGVEVWAGGNLAGSVTAAQWADVEARGSVEAPVTAGTDFWYGDAVVRAGGSVTRDVASTGDADVAAEWDVLGNVSGLEGNVDVVANRDIVGSMNAGGQCEVVAGGNFSGGAEAMEETEVEVSGDVSADVASDGSDASVWAGGSYTGDLFAYDDAILEANWSISATVTAGQSASVIGKGDISGTVESGWVSDVRSSDGEVTANVTTRARPEERLTNSYSPTVQRISKIDAELQRLNVDPAANQTAIADLTTEKEILQLPDLNTDYQHIPAARVRGMIDDGLAKEYDGPPIETVASSVPTKGYVVTADVVGRGGYALLLEPMKYVTVYEPAGDGGTGGGYHTEELSLLGRDDIATTAQFYRVVERFDTPSDLQVEPADFVAGQMSAEHVKAWAEYAAGRISQKDFEQFRDSVEFAFHLIPLAGAVDEFVQGNYLEAGISLAGDAAMLVGLGAAIKGAKCVNAGSKLIKLANRASAAIEGGIIATRAAQGFNALNSPYPEDQAKAWGYFGDATLRLFGLSAQAVQWLKKPKCFVAGTPVHTAFGLKPIETIEAGDRLWAFDRQIGEWRLCPVTHTFKRQSTFLTRVVLGDGTELTGTDGHPFWVIEGENLGTRPIGDHGSDERPGATPGRWVAMRALRVGDVVITLQGRVSRVAAVETRLEAVPVFNLSVEALHCYAVGESGILVHNGGEIYHDGIQRLAKTKPGTPEKPTITVQKGQTPQSTPKGGANAKATEAPPYKKTKPETTAVARDPNRRDRPRVSAIPAGNRAQIEKQTRVQMNAADRAATKAAFDRRQAAQTAGDHAAKTAAGREVGVVGAERFMAREHPSANQIYKDTSGNGNGTFDFVYIEGDQFLVPEAKGLGGRRRTKNKNRGIEGAVRDDVQQGNTSYFDTTIEEMIAAGGDQRAIGLQLKAARLEGKVTYMEIATKRDGPKKWFTISEFRLS
jgi:hypothetical protein